ncbi:ribokinase (plasmid) [Paracoccus liaowanqingii]|uniref:Ribokinase n=1 Tax=Paracoccus liaowanqingii TaxID=2560053 RepID=A0A4Y5SS14_9RHOB|nr:PfkB family carbohydrate kinase [Paracoccus liaowanqingii]QDA36282.1 ribokinase [Paracoccus liaowanqingii]
MKAFVIGNAAIDETVSVEDFPRPGASIFGRALSQDLGGKGVNQAVAIARTGLACHLVAAVGQDPRGREIAARLAAEPVMAQLIALPGVATDNSIILMAGHGENAVITTRAAAGAMTPDHATVALDKAASGDLLVLQGNLGAATTAAALQAARARGMRTVLNPSPLQAYVADLWPLIDCAFLNEDEAAILGGDARLLSHGVAEVVLTIGARGAALVRPDARIEVPATPCTVVDTTGAGDCFMAVALASAALRGVALDARALRHAAVAAAWTVGQAGTVSAFPDADRMRAILAKG